MESQEIEVSLEEFLLNAVHIIFYWSLASYYISHWLQNLQLFNGTGSTASFAKSCL